MPRKQKSPSSASPRPLTGPQRLNKILAAAGLGSRRECEQLIVDGRIEIDGQAVTDLATKVDPEVAKITFDGSALRTFRPVYYALHKPSGVLSTNRDPSGRMRAIDLLQVKERVFSVGRLDRSSEGLMLLTNDGELAQRLAHPRFGIQKLYLATVQGEVTQDDLEKLVRGVYLAEGFAKVDAVKVRRQRTHSADLEIALSEGKNREIRRILARLGHKVVALRRLAIGPLRLGQLPVGGWRPLTRDEVLALYAATTAKRSRKKGPRSAPQSDDKSSAAPGKTARPLALGQFDNPLEEDEYLAYSPLDTAADDDFSVSTEEDLVSLREQPTLGTVIGDDEGDEDQPAPPPRERRRNPDRARSTDEARPEKSRFERNRRPASGPYAGARAGAGGGGRRASFGKKQASGRGARPASGRSAGAASSNQARSSMPPRAGSAIKRPAQGSGAQRNPAASRSDGPKRAAGSRPVRSGADGKSGGYGKSSGVKGPRSSGFKSGGAKAAGPYSRSSSSRGPSSAGSGPARTGTKRPGSKGAGLKGTGVKRAGAKRSGPKGPVKRGGPKPPGRSGNFGKPRGKRS